MCSRNQKSLNFEPFCHSVNQSLVIVFVLGVFGKLRLILAFFYCQNLTSITLAYANVSSAV